MVQELRSQRGDEEVTWILAKQEALRWGGGGTEEGGGVARAGARCPGGSWNPGGPPGPRGPAAAGDAATLPPLRGAGDPSASHPSPTINQRIRKRIAFYK